MDVPKVNIMGSLAARPDNRVKSVAYYLTPQEGEPGTVFPGLFNRLKIRQIKAGWKLRPRHTFRS